MNFRIQEVIKMLVPGTTFLIYIYLLFFDLNDLDKLLKKDYVALYLVVFLVFTYIAGYFMDWFGSLFERTFYWIFDRPSYTMMNDDADHPKHRIYLTKQKDIVEYLNAKLNLENPVARENSLKLFRYANYLKEMNTSPAVKERLSELYFTKIFSRNLMTAFLATFVGYFALYVAGKVGWTLKYDFQPAVLTTIPLFLMTMKRWQENTFYCVRGILYAACEQVLKA